MRTNINVQVGQVWMSSDPRRLRKFRIQFVDMRKGCERADVEILYPRRAFPYGIIQTVNLHMFMQTGTKGYTRIS